MISKVAIKVALAVALVGMFCLGAHAATSMVRYSYDEFNRLIKAEYPEKVIEYGYDGTGNRVVLDIREADPLLAGFSYAPALLALQFTDFSTGSILGWSWDFGDGTTSTDQNPSHAYNSPGTYTVALTITGFTGTDTKSSVIVVRSLIADLGVYNRPGTLWVSFRDLSTGAETSLVWDFGDGTTSNDASTDHTYARPGSYTVTLTVTGTGGVTDTKSSLIVLPPAVADFTVNSTTGTAPLTVYFTDLSSGPITSWTWDFGDGQLGFNNPNGIPTRGLGRIYANLLHFFSPAAYAFQVTHDATHIYTSPGTYTATLTVTDPGGTSSKSITITVSGEQNGTLSVAITPQEAISAGAQWKVDNGEWQIIGATTLTVPIGSHSVYFKDAEGWTTPPMYPVTIATDQTSSAEGSYVIRPVKNITRGTYYPTLQEAYNDAALAGDLLRVLDAQLTENFAANRSISVRIIGGYLPDFTTQANKTIIKGAPVISSGTVTMGNFRISK